jgi:hypothetical protein
MDHQGQGRAHCAKVGAEVDDFGNHQQANEAKQDAARVVGF